MRSHKQLLRTSAAPESGRSDERTALRAAKRGTRKDSTRSTGRVTDKDLETGTLIRIPLRDGRVAVGQIVRPGIEFYMCVFLPVLDSSAAVTLKGLAPALCALMTDAPLYHGRWSICGKEKVHPKVPLPHFKLDDDEGAIIVDIDDKFVRRASPAEEDSFPYRTNVGEDNVLGAIESLLVRGTVDDDDQFMLVSFIKSHR